MSKTKNMLRREAADWLARLQSDRDPDIERKFDEWRNADPRHAAAIDRIRGWYDRAGILRQSRDAASPPIRSPARWAPPPTVAVAAAITILLLAAPLIFGSGRLPFSTTEAVMLTTEVGQIRNVKLRDGSMVTLDTQTSVEIDLGKARRTARLKHGRARFRIARSSAPFVVQTANAQVRAEQGVIDVEWLGRQSLVQVIDGVAEARASREEQTSPVVLAAGAGMTIDADRVQEVTNDRRVPDWTRGMLQFDRTSLRDALAVANRYSDRRIIVDGDLNQLRVSGAFRAGDTTGLARALAAAFHLSLQQRSDSSLILSRETHLQDKNGG